jgi:hypothetical protein
MESADRKGGHGTGACRAAAACIETEAAALLMESERARKDQWTGDARESA